MYQSKHYKQDLHAVIGCFMSTALNLYLARIGYYQFVSFQTGLTMFLMNFSLEVTNKKMTDKAMVSYAEQRKLGMPGV